MLVALGTPHEYATIVGDSLVDANLAGHDSHGVMRLVTYAAAVGAGHVVPSARPVVQTKATTAIVVDGQFGWGQIATRLAVGELLGMVAASGMAAAAIRRCNHIGRLGEIAEALARAGLIGLVVCNTGPTVAPFGGRTRMLGTNPFAFGAPIGAGQPPILVDFATSVVAEGKLAVARERNEPVPLGIIVDRYGAPSKNPEDFYSGGALLPFGGHKGYGLSVMIELLGGVLSGAGPSCLAEGLVGNGTMIIGLDISGFMDPIAFMSQSHGFYAALKAAPAASDDGEILVPGEPEARSREQRTAAGIPIDTAILKRLQHLAGGLGVPSLT